MKIQLQHGLPIVSLTLTQNDQTIVLHNVLFDTGCAAPFLIPINSLN